MTKYQRPFLYLLLSFTLSACTQPAEDPKTVADKYWQYMQTGNISEAEKLVSTNSSLALQKHSNRMNANAKINSGEATTIINTTITTIDLNNNYHHTQTFNTVLVLQQGQWKVDANQSQIPAAPSTKEKELQQLSEELSKSMQENIESMDDAMNQGMQMLDEALRDGSKEMGDSLLHLMNELNTTMQESIDKMKQRREKQRQEQQQPPQSPSQPDPQRGEGMI
jgi:hypothetical protein